MGEQAQTAAEQELRRHVDEITAEGVFAIGAQVFLSTPTSLVTFASGETFAGRPMREATPHNLYCASIPFWIVAMAEAVWQQGCDPLTLTVGDFLPNVDPDRAVRLVDLVTHDATIRGPSSLQWRTTAPEQRDAVLAELRVAAPQPDTGRFSDFVVPYLCRAIVELTWPDPERFLCEHVLAPLGIDVQVVGDRDEVASSVAQSAGTYFFDLPHAPCPLMIDRSAAVLLDAGPANIFGTARSLGRFLQIMGRAVTGAPTGYPPSWQWLSESSRCSRFDATLQRRCSFRGGLMAKLNEHFFGTASSGDSVGVAGIVGASFAFYDPARDLSFAAVLNGLSQGEEDMAYVRASLAALACRIADGQIAGSN